MSSHEVNGDMTPRSRKAYKLLEAGDAKGCLAVLDENEWQDYYQARRAQEARLKAEDKKDARNFIREHKLAIDTLLKMNDYAGRFEEIERRYEGIVPEAEEEEVEIDVILNYADYLRDHSNSQKAEEYLLKAMEIYERLAAADPKAYEGDLALSYNNLAGLYSNTQRTGKAEEYYIKAIDIYKKLANTDPKAYAGKLALCYNNLADLYSEMQRPGKAEECYLKAEEINRKLEN